ncbi:MAG: hypothetical protein ABSA26_12910 [Thermoguttaceae bacterium]|jgi:hypothetical protein
MKRAKKILLWTGIGAGALIAVLLLITACYVWITGSRLEKLLAALKAAGEPICLADLARKPIPPDQNGATYIRRAKDDMSAVDQACEALKYNEEEDCFYAEEIPRLEKAIKSYPNIYPLLEKAACADDFDFQEDVKQKPGDYTNQFLNDIVLIRSGARNLDYRAEVLISKGEQDSAVQSAIILLRLSCQLEREPLIINFLVSCAMKRISLINAHDALQAGPIAEQTREALDAELSLHDSMKQFQKSLKTERAFSIDSFKKQPWTPFSYQWQLGILNLYVEYLNNSTQPYADWIANEPEQKTKGTLLDVYKYLLRPSLKSALTAAYRTQAYIRSLRIINALQGKVPPDSDKIPTMAELGLPDEVGIDPFNGKPMIIKKLSQGWLVYSVGENLKDDGGKIQNDPEGGRPLDVGFGPKIPAPQLKEKESSK